MLKNFKHPSILPASGRRSATRPVSEPDRAHPVERGLPEISLFQPGAFLENDYFAASRRSYRLSFGASFIAGLISAVVGFLIAWVLVRYDFPGKALTDALVDLPFALPTAVAGIALTSLYTENGWLGHWLVPLGIKVAFTPLGIIVALTLSGFPLLSGAYNRCWPMPTRNWRSRLEPGREPLANIHAGDFSDGPAGASDGFCAGFCARSGEYGSVIFISGNLPMRTEITPLLIVTRLEQYDYAGATAIAVVMLVTSFLLLLESMRSSGEPATHGTGLGNGHHLVATPPVVVDRPARDPAVVRWGLTLLALAALALFIVLPLAAVFVQAFAKGWSAYLHAIADPNTLSAAKLSLLAVGVAVP